MDKEMMMQLQALIESSVCKAVENAVPAAVEKALLEREKSDIQGGAASKIESVEDSLLSALGEEDMSDGGYELEHYSDLGKLAGLFGDFSDTAERTKAEHSLKDSRLYGKQIGGYLYSPYFFRRHLPVQFERKLMRLACVDLKKLDIDAVDMFTNAVGVCRVCGVRVKGSESVLESVKRAAAEIVNEYLLMAGNEIPSWQLLAGTLTVRFERTESGNNQLSYCFSDIVTDRAVLPFVVEFLSTGTCLDSDTVMSMCEMFLDGGTPNRFVHELKIHLQSDLQSCAKRYNVKLDEAREQQLLKQCIKRIMKKLEIASDVEKSIDGGDTDFCSIKGEVFCVYKKYSKNTQYAYMVKNVLREIDVLALLEKTGGSIFNERRQFMPLELLQDIFNKNCGSYRQVQEFISNLDSSDLIEFLEMNPEAVSELCYLFVKAGLMYYERDRIAFVQPGNGTVTGASKESIDESAARIMAMDRKALNEAIMLKAVELTKDENTRSVRRMEAF